MLSNPLKPDARFVLGEWTVDPALGCISRAEEVRRVRPLVMDLLRLLVSRQGQVLTKDAIIEGAWAGAAIADSALTSTVAELRQLLGDQAQNPTYIQTIPKRGYRLIAAVSDIAAVAVPGSTSPAALSRDEPLEEPLRPDPGPARLPKAVVATAGTRPTRRTRVWTLGFLLGIACALTVAISMATRRVPSRPATTPAETRLVVALPTGLRLGRTNTPQVAISPDGSRLVYVARTEIGTILCLRTLAAFDTVLMPGTEGARAPFFSPAGDRVAFFAGGELRSVSTAGGRPVSIAPAPAAFGGFWRADDTIVFGGAHGQGLQLISAQGGAARTLTTLQREQGDLSHR